MCTSPGNKLTKFKEKVVDKTKQMIQVQGVSKFVPDKQVLCFSQFSQEQQLFYHSTINTEVVSISLCSDYHSSNSMAQTFLTTNLLYIVTRTGLLKLVNAEIM